MSVENCKSRVIVAFIKCSDSEVDGGQLLLALVAPFVDFQSFQLEPVREGVGLFLPPGAVSLEFSFKHGELGWLEPHPSSDYPLSSLPNSFELLRTLTRLVRGRRCHHLRSIAQSTHLINASPLLIRFLSVRLHSMSIGLFEDGEKQGVNVRLRSCDRVQFFLRVVQVVVEGLIGGDFRLFLEVEGVGQGELVLFV